MADKPASAGGGQREPEDGSTPSSARASTTAPAVDSTAEEIRPDAPEGAPMPEAAQAVEDFLPPPGELVLHDPDDRHEAMVVLDAHDVAMIVQRAQSSALKKWVYALPTGEKGLSIDGVEDIIQQMNWTGKARISTIPETLEVERIVEDLGFGPEPLWSATIFAVDEVTGEKLPGSSIEPVNMRLTEATARKWRAKGKTVPEDRRVFDVFSRQKAIQKAVRNALDGFIPEELEQTVIAMFANDPSRVERIQTQAEAKAAEFPPPLTDDRAKELIARAEELYDQVREAGAGQGKIEFPPGQFAAYLLQSQHSHDRLENFIDYLEKRLAEIEEKYAAAGA